MAPFLATSQLMLAYVRDVYLPKHYSTLAIDHVLGRMSEVSGCGMSLGTVRITDTGFADDVFIFAETTEVLAGAFDLLSEGAAPFRLPVTWIKTKVQTFGNILDAMV